MCKSRRNGRVATLGMFIIDQFQTTSENGTLRMSEEESIGGGGIFAMTCARLFLPPEHCSMIIDTGPDFPSGFRRQLESLGREMIHFRPRGELTTRALNIYSGSTIGEGHQSFKYLSPGLQLHLHDLLLPPSPFSEKPPEWVHIVCSVSRATAMVEEKSTLRMGENQEIWSGNLVWEPMPSSCVPAELDSIIQIAPNLAVISPNALELQSLLSIEPGANTTPGNVVHAAQMIHDLIAATTSQVPTIIVRGGHLGSYTISPQWTGWVPPYFTANEQGRVVDPTGGGNGFLGGLCAGLLISEGDMREGSLYAATAASFAIEQKGLPILSMVNGEERWNSDDPLRRLAELRHRIDATESVDECGC